MRETIGFTSRADNVATEDAAAVKAIRKAGAIIYVKTTMPQIGMVSLNPIMQKIKQCLM
jgi:Asp-tRNA(Asn)/Glu-tRNA(Gln) amidotransferase A subunit family amidase